MGKTFWYKLAQPFNDFVLKFGTTDHPENVKKEWGNIVNNLAFQIFIESVESLGDDAKTLERFARAEKFCSVQLNKKRKDYLNE